ncbi:MAG: hypothetical protein AAFZ49_07590, partial [Cyanobacteria bacterium J06659_2]
MITPPSSGMPMALNHSPFGSDMPDVDSNRCSASTEIVGQYVIVINPIISGLKTVFYGFITL